LAAQDVELDQLERQVEHDGGPKRGDVELHEAIAHASDAENELRVLKAECAVLRECVGMERDTVKQQREDAEALTASTEAALHHMSLQIAALSLRQALAGEEADEQRTDLQSQLDQANIALLEVPTVWQKTMQKAVDLAAVTTMCTMRTQSSVQLMRSVLGRIDADKRRHQLRGWSRRAREAAQISEERVMQRLCSELDDAHAVCDAVGAASVAALHQDSLRCQKEARLIQVRTKIESTARQAATESAVALESIWHENRELTEKLEEENRALNDVMDTVDALELVQTSKMQAFLISDAANAKAIAVRHMRHWIGQLRHHAVCWMLRGWFSHAHAELRSRHEDASEKRELADQSLRTTLINQEGERREGERRNESQEEGKTRFMELREREVTALLPYMDTLTLDSTPLREREVTATTLKAAAVRQMRLTNGRRSREFAVLLQNWRSSAVANLRAKRDESDKALVSMLSLFDSSDKETALRQLAHAVGHWLWIDAGARIQRWYLQSGQDMRRRHAAAQQAVDDHARAFADKDRATVDKLLEESLASSAAAKDAGVRFIRRFWNQLTHREVGIGLHQWRLHMLVGSVEGGLRELVEDRVALKEAHSTLVLELKLRTADHAAAQAKASTAEAELASLQAREATREEENRAMEHAMEDELQAQEEKLTVALNKISDLELLENELVLLQKEADARVSHVESKMASLQAMLDAKTAELRELGVSARDKVGVEGVLAEEKHLHDQTRQRLAQHQAVSTAHAERIRTLEVTLAKQGGDLSRAVVRVREAESQIATAEDDAVIQVASHRRSRIEGDMSIYGNNDAVIQVANAEDQQRRDDAKHEELSAAHDAVCQENAANSLLILELQHTLAKHEGLSAAHDAVRQENAANSLLILELHHTLDRQTIELTRVLDEVQSIREEQGDFLREEDASLQGTSRVVALTRKVHELKEALRDTEKRKESWLQAATSEDWTKWQQQSTVMQLKGLQQFKRFHEDSERMNDVLLIDETSAMAKRLYDSYDPRGREVAQAWDNAMGESMRLLRQIDAHRHASPEDCRAYLNKMKQLAFTFERKVQEWLCGDAPERREAVTKAEHGTDANQETPSPASANGLLVLTPGVGLDDKLAEAQEIQALRRKRMKELDTKYSPSPSPSPRSPQYLARGAVPPRDADHIEYLYMKLAESVSKSVHTEGKLDVALQQRMDFIVRSPSQNPPNSPARRAPNAK